MFMCTRLATFSSKSLYSTVIIRLVSEYAQYLPGKTKPIIDEDNDNSDLDVEN